MLGHVFSFTAARALSNQGGTSYLCTLSFPNTRRLSTSCIPPRSKRSKFSILSAAAPNKSSAAIFVTLCGKFSRSRSCATRSDVRCSLMPVRPLSSPKRPSPFYAPHPSNSLQSSCGLLVERFAAVFAGGALGDEPPRRLALRDEIRQRLVPLLQQALGLGR